MARLVHAARNRGAGRFHGASSSAGVLSIQVPAAGRTATITYRPAGGGNPASRNPREVFLAVLGFDVKSDVKAGENRGRALTHDFVAISLEKQPLTDRDGAVEFRLPTRPAGVGRLALAAWVVQTGKSEAPEQAAGGWLPP